MPEVRHLYLIPKAIHKENIDHHGLLTGRQEQRLAKMWSALRGAQETARRAYYAQLGIEAYWRGHIAENADMSKFQAWAERELEEADAAFQEMLGLYQQVARISQRAVAAVAKLLPKHEAGELIIETPSTQRKREEDDS
jgi:hypothetical protein